MRKEVIKITTVEQLAKMLAELSEKGSTFAKIVTVRPSTDFKAKLADGSKNENYKKETKVSISLVGLGWSYTNRLAKRTDEAPQFLGWQIKVNNCHLLHKSKLTNYVRCFINDSVKKPILNRYYNTESGKQLNTTNMVEASSNDSILGYKAYSFESIKKLYINNIIYKVEILEANI